MSKQEIDKMVKTRILANPDKRPNRVMSDIVGDPLSEDRG